MIDMATEALGYFDPSNEVDESSKLVGEGEAPSGEGALALERDPIVDIFGIPTREYRQWPERRQHALLKIAEAPERFSRRTIHTIGMLDAADWTLVEKIAPYAVHGHLFAGRASDSESRGVDIGLTELLQLDAMGVVTAANGFIAFTLQPQSEQELYQAFRVGDYGLVLWFQDSAQAISWNVTPITRAGQQLLAALGAVPDSDYLQDLGEAFGDHGVRTELWEVADIPQSSQFRLENRLWEVLPEQEIVQ